MGFQFENLVLNNLNVIIKKLDIAPETIISAAPYFQKKTLRKEACQIDLLIHTRFSVYVCEIKYRKRVDGSIIKSIEEKIKKLKAPKNLSIRLVLIYAGELSDNVRTLGMFSQCISFEDLLY